MLSLTAALALAVPVAAQAAGDAPAPLTGPAVGTPAPAFTLTTIDGRTITLDSFRGKTLVINIWATWCPPCREETPGLLKAYAKIGGSGDVAFLGVDTTEQAPLVRAFVASKNVPYPQAIGDSSFENAYDIAAFPTTFVIDPQGIVRARYIDSIGANQLVSYVAEARAGRNVVVTSPLQSKIDAVLTDPSIAFAGSAADVYANAKRAQDAIDKADAMTDESDVATGNNVDYLRTVAEQSALRDRAIAALKSLPPDKSRDRLLAQLQGDAASARSQWQDALTHYAAALAVDPDSEDALGGSARAAAELKQYPALVAFDERLVKLDPESVSARISLARAYMSAGRKPDAYAAADAATTLAQKQADAKPGDQSRLKMLAWAHLYAGRVYAKGGENAKARAEFDLTRAAALKLPPTSSRYAMYIEEAQEATVALDLGSGSPVTTVSLAPWTGADLPGSIPSTIKYRLAVAGTPNAGVTIAAKGLPKGWVASFCTDRLCAPFKVSVVLPASGVKVIEFQLVPDVAGSAEPQVTVVATDGKTSAQASNLALR